MDKQKYRRLLPFVIVLTVVLLGIGLARIIRSGRQPLAKTPAVPETLRQALSYELLATHPHDSACYTQGLVIDEGVFYESCGLYGKSSLRKVDPADGSVLAEVALDPKYFAEGLVLLDGKLYQLTWQENTGFIYDADTLEHLSSFHYQTQGWGLTTDGSALILSDGTNTLYWLDPGTMQV
ncbi:MAG: glutaminyl-peptide cyclotransferase, partial [Chloroflexi bacterium]|nr:glutaminyl-peptide cyclotransferase [Chloroflexota bacterium]